MYSVSTAFRTALESGAAQKIKGTVILKDDTDYVVLSDSNISKPTITRQCTTSADSFGYAELYTSTVSVKVLGVPELVREDLRDGKITLQFGVEGVNEWVPLGTWNITEPQRDTGDAILINGVDNTAKLDVPISDNSPGAIKFKTRMDEIESLTGLSFAQTAQEILDVGGVTESLDRIYGSTFCATCRAELIAMAQFIGGCVYINRSGEIEFRKYGDNSYVPTIPANKRFKADLREYSYRVGSLTVINKYGTETKNTTVTGTANTNANMIVQNNPYLRLSFDNEFMHDRMQLIVDNLASAGVWVPGQIDYYGDPTIDLGDVLTLSGGVNGSTTSQFLVTGIVWQFRGPQTLISAGAGTGAATGTGSSSGSASSGGSQSVIIQQATIGAVNIDFYRDSFTTLIEIGEVMVAAANETVGIVQLTVQLQGTDDADNEIRILRDGIMQTTCSCDTIASAQKHTVSLTAVLDLSEGIHIISVEAKGSAAILRAVGTVYGQGLQEFTGNPTFESNYTASGGVISAYNGDDDMPRIPAQLGGSDVETIGSGAFRETDIEYANIPQGTEVIR